MDQSTIRPVITIMRAYGSLGDEIAQDVAKRLGYRLVDHDIIAAVAERLGVPESVVTELDEREGRLVRELVRSLQRYYPSGFGPAGGSSRKDIGEDAYFQVVVQILDEICRAGNAVVVGRGGAFVLAGRPGVLRVLVHAPLEVRVERVMAATGSDRQSALRRIRRSDAERGRYIKRFHGADWLSIEGYDLVVNTGLFTREQAAGLVVQAAQLPAGQPG